MSQNWDFEEYDRLLGIHQANGESSWSDELLVPSGFQSRFFPEENLNLRDDSGLSDPYDFSIQNPNPQNQLNLPPSFSQSFLPTSPQLFTSNEELILPSPSNTSDGSSSDSSLVSPQGALSDDSPVSLTDVSSTEQRNKRERGDVSSYRVNRGRVKRLDDSKTGTISMTHDMSVVGTINQDSLGFELVTLRSDDKVPFLTAISYMFESPSNNFPRFEGFSTDSAMFGDYGVPLGNGSSFREQLIQFSEFEDRTFNLLGENDQEKLRSFIPSPRRGIRIDAPTLINLLHNKGNQLLLLDARFEYEYSGGTIGKYTSEDEVSNVAININEFWNLKKIFEALWIVDGQSIVPRYPGKALVVFCEFSSLRGPGLYRNITLLDHLLLYVKNYFAPTSQLSYPEIYVLNEGFHGFFQYTKNNFFDLALLQKIFLVTSKPSGFHLDFFVSEFSQSSETFWKTRNVYLKQKTYITELSEILRNLENDEQIHSAFTRLWNPFTMNHDSFDAFKRVLGGTIPGFLSLRQSQVSLEEFTFEPSAQRPRLGLNI